MRQPNCSPCYLFPPAFDVRFEKNIEEEIDRQEIQNKGGPYFDPHTARPAGAVRVHQDT